jgi:L-ascorbate metabolism protein UlaG (beta-lactamase superfamily)
MRVHWYGQSAFLLEDEGKRVLVDPYFTGEAIPMRFDYPPIEGVGADVLLITHEHPDHNNDGAVSDDPVVVRCVVGETDTPIGTVVGIASEHDDAGGTQAGPNVIYRFGLGGLDIVFLGDLGQSALRPEQVEAIGTPDVLFVPVGGGYTIGSEVAEQVSRQLGARWIVPMHFGSSAIDLPEPVGAFADRFDDVEQPSGAFEVGGDRGGPVVVVPPMPGDGND